jgi:hypothetical protein
MAPTVTCSRCGHDMQFEVRVPRIGTPGEFHYFFSCVCGRVTSHARKDNEEALPAEQFPSESFVSWATRKDGAVGSPGRGPRVKKERPDQDPTP